MPSSNKEYWEKREAELGAVVKGTRARKPSRKRQADSNREREEVNSRQKTTMNDESSTDGKEKVVTVNMEVGQNTQNRNEQKK